MRVAPPAADVTIDGLDRLPADRDQAGPTPLAVHHDRGLIEVDVTTPGIAVHPCQVGDLGQPPAAVVQQHEDRGVAYVVEALLCAAGKDGPHLIVGQGRYGCLRHVRRLHLRHRRVDDLTVILQPTEQLLEAAVPVGDRAGTAPGLKKVLEEPLDVLRFDGRDGSGQAVLGQKSAELFGGLGVGLDGARRAVLGHQMPSPGGQQDAYIS